MPIYKASVTSPTQFDGLAAATGLFDPAANTGGRAIQVRINSVFFSGATAITNRTLRAIDPSDGQSTIIVSGATVNLAAGGPAGYFVIPTNADGTPWRLTFATTGMVGTGVLAIDYDFIGTEG